MIDLFRPFIAPDAAARVAAVFTPDANGRVYVGEGPRTAEFERAFSAAIGIPGVQAVNSCTAALDLALHLCGVGPGDVVISTPLTCTATNGAIVNRGARILWADVDPETGCIDPASVGRQWHGDVKAIMAVDWAGRSCDYRELRSFRAAIRYGQVEASSGPVPVIQDAAHHPYVDPDNHGDYVCWSFGPIKHLTCGGYGGALLVPPEQRARARLLRWHGLDRLSSADFRCAQTIHEAGYRYHLTDDLASVGLANLPHLPALVAKHRANAAFYDRALAGLPGVRLPPPDPACDYWLYDVRVTDRDAFMAHLAAQGIASSPVHRRNDVHPAYSFPSDPAAARLRLAKPLLSCPLPGVDSYDASHAAIPVGWWLSEHDRERVAAAVIAWAHAPIPC